MHPRADLSHWPPGAGGRSRPCWSSCASAATCTRARRTRTSPTAGSPTTGAARRARRRICWRTCTTAACCAWRERAGHSHLRGHEHAPGPLDAAARARHVDALVDVLVRKYAPLPGPSLAYVVNRLRYAVPQWQRDVKSALLRARQRLAHARVDGVDWYWPAGERPGRHAAPDAVRLLAPFDPVVWDRRRFELFWGWAYRFEAYTPASKRQRGYYALPMLWRDQVIGWGNLAVKDGGYRPNSVTSRGTPRATARSARARGRARAPANVPGYLLGWLPVTDGLTQRPRRSRARRDCLS